LRRSTQEKRRRMKRSDNNNARDGTRRGKQTKRKTVFGTGGTGAIIEGKKKAKGTDIGDDNRQDYLWSDV